MSKTEAQQCRTIQLLLSSMRLEYLWAAHGPTEQACQFLESSPLSFGEQLLLGCAFDLRNGAGATQAPHVNAELHCSECQGPVETRDVLQKEVSTSMNTCRDCHRVRNGPMGCSSCHQLGY